MSGDDGLPANGEGCDVLPADGADQRDAEQPRLPLPLPGEALPAQQPRRGQAQAVLHTGGDPVSGRGHSPGPAGDRRSGRWFLSSAGTPSICCRTQPWVARPPSPTRPGGGRGSWRSRRCRRGRRPVSVSPQSPPKLTNWWLHLFWLAGSQTPCFGLRMGHEFKILPQVFHL